MKGGCRGPEKTFFSIHTIGGESSSIKNGSRRGFYRPQPTNQSTWLWPKNWSKFLRNSHFLKSFEPVMFVTKFDRSAFKTCTIDKKPESNLSPDQRHGFWISSYWEWIWWDTLTHKRSSLFSPGSTTQREWYFSVITLPISNYPSYYMANPLSETGRKVFFSFLFAGYPLWNLILGPTEKWLCSTSSTRKNRQQSKGVSLSVQTSIKLNNKSSIFIVVSLTRDTSFFIVLDQI